MAVNGTQTSVSYISDGITAQWAVPFYLMAFSDLVVTELINGVSTTLVLGTAWTGSGAPDSYGAYPNGGAINFLPGYVPAAGATITISRQTARTQPTTWRDNNPFSATVIEHALDRLTLIAQEVLGGSATFLGVMAGPPSAGNYAAGNWAINSNPQPGGPFGWVCTQSGNPGVWNPWGTISL